MADLISMLAACGGAGGEVDPNFNQTVLLLHGDGTNGAQNNTFLDSSTNNFTITRNGNTTQGTFSPFSVGESQWSNHFDGSGDYLSFADNAAFNFDGEFTIEAWCYRTVNGVNQTILAKWATGQEAWLVRIETDNTLKFWFENTSITTTAVVPTNAWFHVAVTRDSSDDIRVFLNGTQTGSTTNNSVNITSTTSTYVGAYSSSGSLTSYLTGYVSNARVVKGSALYTSAFTPSTSPLTAVSGTSLLTCQSNRFVDNSSNAFAITRNGDVKVTPFSPFAPTAAYDASVNGGSGYFDGTGDFLSVGSASDWTTFHNGSDWTAEFWCFNSGTGSQTICGTTSATPEIGFVIINNDITANTVTVYFLRGVLGSFASFVSNAALKINQWNHVAITFQNSGKTCTFYINGVQEGSSSNTGFAYSASAPTSTLTIAAVNGVTSFTGYLSNLRLSTNIRTGLTSIPTAPYTSDANTKLLCNFTNAGIFDNTGKNNLETVGNAQIDTTTKKFGTGSMEFDGTGDALTYRLEPYNVFGSADFTIEMWIYPNNVSTTQYFFSTDSTTAIGVAIFIRSTGYFGFNFSNNGSSAQLNTTGTTSLSTGTWYHIAVVRNGNTGTMYVNGVSDSSGSFTGSIYATGAQPTIGARDINESAPFNGLLDDVRVTLGVARYTTTFTPPTKAFPDL